MDTTKSDVASENSPFGRQPEPVSVTFYGDPRDCETYIRKIISAIEHHSYDVTTRAGMCVTIYPRAVND